MKNIYLYILGILTSPYALICHAIQPNRELLLLCLCITLVTIILLVQKLIQAKKK